MKKVYLILLLVLASVACKLPSIVIPKSTPSGSATETATPASVPALNMGNLQYYSVIELVGYTDSCSDLNGKESHDQGLGLTFKNGSAIWSLDSNVMYTKFTTPEGAIKTGVNPFVDGVTVQLAMSPDKQIVGYLFVSNCGGKIYTWISDQPGIAPKEKPKGIEA